MSNSLRGSRDAHPHGRLTTLLRGAFTDARFQAGTHADTLSEEVRMLLLLLLGCPTKPTPEPETCETLLADFEAETAAIRACTDADECGQPLTGTSCGCTRAWVARTDADTTRFYELLSDVQANECTSLDGTCDCPEADGYVCDDGVCEWNYVDPYRLAACSTADGQPYTLAGASITGDTLTADLTVGGGCGDHEFTLCWPDQAFMESEPVQASLQILHETDDPCDSIVPYTPTFDLTPLKIAWQTAYGATSGTIVVHLDGETLTYTF